MTELAQQQQPMLALADDLGVVDGLLFRRVSAVSWAHLGGFGRGRGWAGIVDVDADEPALAAIGPESPHVQRFDTSESAHVIGPYYARSGALVRVGYDVIVVLGNPVRSISHDVSDDQLRALAELVDLGAEEVTPSKRLGDELEILHAVRAVITTPSSTMGDTMTHILEVAIEALSCELGILRDGHGIITVVGDAAGIQAQTVGLAEAMDEIADLTARNGKLCLQQVAPDSSLRLTRLDPRIRSILSLPIGAPLGGTLVVAHTSAGPRGFTSLCQRLGEQLVDTASVIGHTAALREELRDLADQQGQAARTDSLTGLGNRLLWEEAVTAAQLLLDAGTSMTVITLDVDGLKAVNDSFGHEAGDDLLRRCADVLRAHSRAGDLAVRMGGDEFAMLLPLDAQQARQRLDDLTASLDHPCSDHARVAASLGAATADPGQRLVGAYRAADTAMYSRKRARVARPVR